MRSGLGRVLVSLILCSFGALAQDAPPALQPPKTAKRELEAEPEPAAKPESWTRASAALQKAIDSKNPTGVSAAAKDVGAWDSAETATKLISAFLQCVKQFEAIDVQDQKAIKGLDEAVPPLINAYVKAMTSQSNTDITTFNREQRKYRDQIKAEELLSDRMLGFDRMVEDVLEGLATMRTREALQTILKQAQASFNLRYRARLIEAMGSIRTASSVAGLVDILQRSTRDIETLAAVRALRTIGIPTPETVPVLVSVLASEYRQVRTTAAHALAEMGCRDNTAAIIESLKGTTGQTASDLNDALKMLT